MIKKDLPVIKVRKIAVTVSAILLVIGIASYIINGGFNKGIDFESGLSERIQVAPVGLQVTYEGKDDATLSVTNGNVVLETRGTEGVHSQTFLVADNPTAGDLAKSMDAVSGITATAVDASLSTSDLLSGYGFPATLSKDPTSLNFAVGGNVTIDQVRAALSSLGNVQVQTMGTDSQQLFQVRIGTGAGDTQASLENAVSKCFAGAFGENGFVVLESNFVGPRFSRTLITSSLIAVLVAMVLILLYVWFRFHIAYAVSSIIALCHDVLMLLGFIALFQFEVSSTTIAAVLTIIGYSLNATIVIFDRVRENSGLMKDKSFADVIQHSVTQSLTRTIMSSLTTVLAVLPLAILATGSIQLFAINLIFGIVVGTYSSNFIAPAFLYWISGGQHIVEKKESK
ncbi:MAG: protein translocase subunit SecF [Spirochaetia bacterium]|jgi:preprotein translocase subunit SecF|nr:protein translocase subunit SecF [Spirochaetia bacterium]